MPGHRHEDQADFLSFAENPDADEGKNLRKRGKGDTPGYGGGRNAFLTSPKNSWYGEDMTPARKAAMAREWIIFALSFGLGGHIALGLVLHNPSPARWQEMGWNIFFIGLFVYIAVQAGRSIYMAIRSHGAERDP